MSIDTERLHRLKGKGFDKLYASSPEKYKGMAHTALKYAQACEPSGEQVKVGDVISVIQNAIKIDPAFEAHLKQKKLIQKFWVTYFAEYIVDQVFPQPDLTGPK
ncbi:MAG: hypothetical protein WBD46_03875 [Acidobacteriaceae bacterium]